MRIAVLNAGSATVKAALVEADAGGAVPQARHAEDVGPEGDLRGAFRRVLDAVGAEPGGVDAVGHRIVHGGTRFTDPVAIDPGVEEALEALAPLAPLHNPPALEGVRVARERLPDAPAVGVFDTAFHAGRGPASFRYALPRKLADELGLYRYGFHGIAHAALAEALAGAEGTPLAATSAVTLQLGAGCSACAVEDGRSVETSMGFSPLEGLCMATRCGDLDPGVVLELWRRGHEREEVEALLARRSGLRGLAGSGDLREVLRAERAGDERATAAVELFVRRIVATVGAYLTLLGGRGALVFGGGIGAGSPEIRKRVGRGLAAWNVALDPERNAAGAPGRLSAEGTRPVHAFETDEERPIARAVYRVLAGSPPRGESERTPHSRHRGERP